MTLERRPLSGHRETVHLVECPFCGADLPPDRGSVPEHLATCEAFERAWRDRDDGGAGDDHDCAAD